MNTDEMLVDLGATVSYVAGITENVDAMTFEQMVAIQDEARRVRAKADELIEMIDGELIRQLEGGAREYGGRLFKRSKRYVTRHDHEPLIALAARQGVEAWTHPDSGEIDAPKAAESACRALAKMFLSPSSTAKVTVVDRLGVDRDVYESREFKDWRVQVIEEDEG